MTNRNDDLDEKITCIIWENKEPIGTKQIQEKLKEKNITVSRGTIINRLKKLDGIENVMNPKTKKNGYQHKDHLSSSPLHEEYNDKLLSEKDLKEFKTKLRSDIGRLAISENEIVVIPDFYVWGKKYYSPDESFSVETLPYYSRLCRQYEVFVDIPEQLSDIKKNARKHINLNKLIEQEIADMIFIHFDVETFNKLMKKRVSQKKFKQAFYEPHYVRDIDSETREIRRNLHELWSWICKLLFLKSVLQNIREQKTLVKFQKIAKNFESNVSTGDDIFSYCFHIKGEKDNDLKKHFVWSAKKDKITKKEFKNDTDIRLKKLFTEISTSKSLKKNMENLQYYTDYLKHKTKKMKERFCDESSGLSS
jgi:hypothetical protein